MNKMPGVPPSEWWQTISANVRNRVMPSGQDREQPAQPVAPSDDRTGLARRLAPLLPRLVLVAAVALLLFTLAVFIFRATYSDRVYPAVAVGDVPVGGMTVNEAVSAVENRATGMQQGTISFTYQGQTWTPSLSELGAEVDVEGSVQDAYALGRDENAVSRLGFTNQLLRDDQRVPLRTTINRGALNSWFASVNADLDMRAVDANLVIDGTTVRVTPESSGFVVDQDAATAIILQSLETLEPVAIELPVKVERPDVRAVDLEDQAASLQQSLSEPVVAVFEGTSWNIDPADLVEFLSVDVSPGDDGATLDLTMDRKGLAAWLRDRFSGKINRPPSNARVGWRQGEGLLALEPSVDGAALRSSAFAGKVAESFLATGGSPVEIPVVTTKPKIDSNNLDALKINSLLARGDSNYGGQSWKRDTNVEVATNLLSGELVAPGEEFSFNKAIGKITKDKGYVESGVIVNGRASTADGGGVCQVSTTMFRATILAGLPITDWEEHTQRLMIYEQDGWTAGYDASIIQWGDDPSKWGDFKFRNDTGGYVLIQSWTSYPHVIVEIYGNDDGREVEVGDAQVWEATSYPDDVEVVDPTQPEGFMTQTEWPKLGAEAVFTLTVTYADGTVKEQEFYSVYNGHGNVWTVSPDMQGQSPAS